MKTIGTPIARVEGPLKVTGHADYAADHRFPGLLHAVPVGATIAKGTLTRLDTSRAERMPGVRAIYHRKNLGSRMFRTSPDTDFTAYMDEHRPPFEDDAIRYHGQYVALVLADTFEQAQAAARAVEATYRAEMPNVAPDLGIRDGKPETPLERASHRGNLESAFAGAPVKIDAVYTTPPETHSAIELHGTIAVPEGDAITLYETSQAVVNHRNVLFQQLGTSKENVRVISKYLGSGFGGKLFPWPHSVLAAAAAREIGRPVKLVLDRATVFQAAGHRPMTEQRIRLGAGSDGKLVAFGHDFVNTTAMIDDYKEDCGEATGFLYSVPNLQVRGGLARRNIGNPTSMRGPGAVPGLFATETALDELAVALRMDPVELRVRNEPKIDESKGIPFSSRHLLECYKVGAERFGWAKRTPGVGSMTRDGLTLGWGMAACAWIAERFPAEATVDLRRDGTARVASGTQEIGTGTLTMLAQLTAERLGIPVERIEVVLGDTTLPPGPINGGSMATGSLVPAVYAAADAAIAKLLNAAATAKGSRFSGKKPPELAFTEGRVHVKGESATKGMPFGEALAAGNVQVASGHGKAEGTFGAPSEVSRHSFGAHFLEVTWEAATARLRVNRVVTVIDAGRIVNPKTARNQIAGSIVMGVGMGLFEETAYDRRTGAPINRNLADYVMATHADAPALDIHFLDYPDLALNEIGARGVGEIGLAGIAAAISNATYHATGVRVRDLPISIEDLLSAGL